MGGVRGDVIGLGFMQTRIMEMGQSPPEQRRRAGMWVHSRQYTGRIVTVTNDKIFDEPVYNYTHEFAYLWDEFSVPNPFPAGLCGGGARDPGRCAPACPYRPTPRGWEVEAPREKVRD